MRQRQLVPESSAPVVAELQQWAREDELGPPCRLLKVVAVSLLADLLPTLLDRRSNPQLGPEVDKEPRRWLETRQEIGFPHENRDWVARFSCQSDSSHYLLHADFLSTFVYCLFSNLLSSSRALDSASASSPACLACFLCFHSCVVFCHHYSPAGLTAVTRFQTVTFDLPYSRFSPDLVAW